MSISRSLLQLFLVASLGWLLSACEGSNTVANPNLNTSDPGYSGPPARTADIRSFEQNFWNFLKEDNRCGECHTAGGQPPAFVDKTDVNAAYAQAIQIVSLVEPNTSEIVAKAMTGHKCWLGQSAGSACAGNIEQMIINWATDSNVTSSRLIQLTPPEIKNPGDARSFPAFSDPTGAAFATTVHPILVDNCQNCHEDIATPLPIAPFFANADPASAYEAAKPKMDIDTPAISRLVVRLRQEAHNCWTNSCADDANEMQTAITNFATGISIDPINTDWKTSKALNIDDGIAAAGGNRHESNLVALWEFRSGSGNEAYDTSGIDPSMTLQMQGSYQWLGGYGLDLSNGYAIASPFDSVKLKTFIEATGEYAIETWVVPANVTQQNANIVSYSSGALRNFTLGQEMYSYEMFNRIDDPDPLTLNGEPFITSGDSGEELLQSSLQHVVANYDPIEGRSIYINGTLVEDPAAPGVSLDPITAPTTIGNVVWSPSYAFVLGADVAGINNWDGQVRMVAIHNRTLTEEQILQNFDVGVGETFYMLFFVGHHWGESITDPKSFILFEVSQFDSYGYLFEAPRFINLDPTWVPSPPITLKGMRIGINGKIAVAGQAYANIDTTINATDFQLGQQELSPLGTVIALEKSAATDEFFLSFEDIGGQSFAFADPKPAAPPAPVDPATPVVADIGMRTFEEISATISAITGIPVNDERTFNGNTVSVKGTYDSYVQQLPAVEAIDAYLPSHQMAVAQLALASCNTLVEIEALSPSPVYFPGFTFFGQDARTTFGEPPVATHYNPAEPTAGTPLTAQQIANRAAIVDKLMTVAMNADQTTPANNLTSQPGIGQVQAPVSPEIPGISGLLGAGDTQDLGVPGASAHESLISQMLGCRPDGPTVTEPNPTCSPVNSVDRTKQIVKAVCAAAVGSATMLVQ